MENAKEYFGTDFVEKINEIFKKAKQEERFMFIHGTPSIYDAIESMLRGLKCEYPELLYTALLMKDDDKLLFEKLKNWPMWNLKYLLMISVPKNSGKGGIPIWIENSIGEFCLSPQLINGLIDVNNKSILINPKYDSSKKIEATVEDRSFETKTGKCIEISLPPDEIQFYENNQNSDGR